MTEPVIYFDGDKGQALTCPCCGRKHEVAPRDGGGFMVRNACGDLLAKITSGEVKSVSIGGAFDPPMRQGETIDAYHRRIGLKK